MSREVVQQKTTNPNARRVRRSRLIGALGWTWIALLLLFLFFPIGLMVPSSFTDSDVMQFPPSGMSTRWYEEVLTAASWQQSALTSLRIGILSAAIASVAGLLIALRHFRGKRVGSGSYTFFMLPLLVPNVILATGLFSIVLRLGVLGQEWALAIAHAGYTLPISIMMLLAAVDQLDPRLWDTARSLGAKSIVVLRSIVLPIIMPAFLASLIMTFMLSWDEVTFAIFIGPRVNPTLPAQLFYYIQEFITPAVAAISTLLLIATIAIGVLVGVARKSTQKKR
ncbi:ABC transporter permease [Leucobacter sp. GX24907]